VSDNSTDWNTVKSITANNNDINSFNIKASGRYVRMSATASKNNGVYSLKEFTVYGSFITSCGAPTGLTVNMIDTNSAVIRWDPTQTATAYTLSFKPKSSSAWQTFNTTEDTFLVNGLSCNTNYQYA